MSHRTCSYLLALTLLSAPAVPALAQNAFVSGAGSASFTQEPAPIERGSLAQSAPPQDKPAGSSRDSHKSRTFNAQPARGVSVRSDAAFQTVASDAQHVELKLEHGRANIMVHDPAENQLVLIDLPGGQTQLLKNGFYTFNADTNTVRVFSGEADAFAGNQDKPAHIKGDDQAVFSGGNVKVGYSDPYYARLDVLPGTNGSPNSGYAARPEAPAYGYAPNPYGYYGSYGSPYYAYDYPYYGYGWGYPYYGWGYGVGFGWGGYYGGGYYGGGYRGGYGNGGGVGRGGGVPIHPGSGGHR